MMIIGIDAHKRSHTAVTIDEMGRAGVAKTVGTTTQDHLLLRWASGVGEERLWAIEDCLRNPVHLAKAIASLDQISGGRIEIGLATGAPFRMFSAFDVDPADYMARFSEGLRLMQQVWTWPRVDLDGRFWQLRNVLFA